MTRRTFLLTAFVLLLAGVIVIVLLQVRRGPASAAANAAATPSQSKSTAVPGQPRRRTLFDLSGAELAVKRTAPRPYESPLLAQVLAAKDWYAFYRSLDGRTDADAKFFRASVLERCKGWESTYKGLPKDVRIRDWMNKLSGPYVDLRRNILLTRSAETAQDQCAKFPAAITQKDIEDAYTEAADAGSAHARLLRLYQTVRAGATSNVVKVGGVPFTTSATSTFTTPQTLSEADVQQLKAALASRDPSQILFAGPILTATYKEYELKFGDGQGLVGIYDGFLWKSVACHFGGGCGPESRFVIEDCVTNGRCDVESYDDKLRKYILTPEQWPRFQAYRDTLIRAIEGQDWALLQERRGPRTNVSGSNFPPLSSPRFQVKFP